MRLDEIFNDLINPAITDKEQLLFQLEKLMSKADSFEPIAHKNELIKVDGDIFTKVWQEASKWRESGRLLDLVKKIRCPIIAIHGDYDPHPAEGIEKPLAKASNNFKFFLLEKCGHTPWIEKYAKDRFYDILREELK